MPVAKHIARRTKIVCTLGPATSAPEVIEDLIRAGMNVARFNLSHGTRKEHEEAIEIVRQASKKLGIPVSILMDLPGPKYRTGKLKTESVPLRKGAEVTLTTRPIEGDEKTVPLNLPDLSRSVNVGDTVLLDDGAMILTVLGTDETDVRTRVVVGGTLTLGRGVVVPGMRIPGPFITELLRQDIDFALEKKPDFIALSFIQSPDDISQVKSILASSGANIPIISKIERGVAVKNFDRILEVTDAVMVARGDLGVDIPMEKIPLVQKEIIRKCNLAGKAVITATQLLESMMNNVRPMRAEVTDIANAIFDGSDAVMLSGETSIGKYPVESVIMMAQVADETEKALPYDEWLRERGEWVRPLTDELISYNACYTADRLGAVAIIAFTQSGSTARRVSKYRPKVPILAITANDQISGRLWLYWGVQAYNMGRPASIDELFNIGTRLVKETGIARSGDLVVITGGLPLGVPGSTNVLRVSQVP